jgi:hypothetical protein
MRLGHSSECQFAARAAAAVRGSSNSAHSRRWYFEPSLGLGRLIDPGAPALALQAVMGLLPGRRFGNFLQPVSDRSFIAPFNRGITRRCAPDRMKERIAASSIQTVRVQKARLASRSTEIPRFPTARLA